MQELLDREAVCKRLGISMRTLERLVSGGEILPVRIGALVRFAPRDLDAFIQRKRDGHDGPRPDVDAYLRRLEQLVPGFDVEQRQRLVQIAADVA